MSASPHYIPHGSPRDSFGMRHFCHDETAIVVNDRWLCKCVGSPFFASGKALLDYKKEQQTETIERQSRVARQQKES